MESNQSCTFPYKELFFYLIFNFVIVFICGLFLRKYAFIRLLYLLFVQDGFEKANLEKFMVFPEADTREIYSVAISVSESPCKPLQIKTNISSPVAVDYDPLDRKIYWTDVALKLVARAFPNGSSVEVVAYNKVEGPEGLAVDYIERNLYWTDAGTRKIEVARLDGSSRRSLITSGIESPRAIILNIAER